MDELSTLFAVLSVGPNHRSTLMDELSTLFAALSVGPNHRSRIQTTFLYTTNYGQNFSSDHATFCRIHPYIVITTTAMSAGAANISDAQPVGAP
jgi:hypothetical protein